jgi:hypothetical protein
MVGCGNILTEAPSPCAPGHQIACACPSGGQGVQVCKADGSGYGACGCGGSGGGGTGGASSSTGGVCAQGSVIDCYDGPTGTEGVGVCKGGKSYCDDGHAYSPCIGQVLPSPELCSTPEDDDCDGATTPCQGETSSSSGAGGGGAGGAGGGGASSSSGSGGGGATGWSHGYLASGNSNPFGLGVDGAGEIVLGIAGSGVDAGNGPLPGQSAILRFDAMGNLLWAKGYPGTGGGMAVHPSGDVYVAGSFGGTIDLGPGPMSCNVMTTCLFVARLDPGGNVLWSRSAQPNWGVSNGSSVAVDAAGDVVVGIDSQGSLDVGNGPLAASNVNGNAFVAKLSGSNGDALWSKAGICSGGAGIHSIVIDSLGDTTLLGVNLSQLDFGGGALPGPGFFVMKFNPSGSPISAKSFGDGNGSIEGALDSADNLLVSGHLKTPIDFGGGPLPATGAGDVYVAKLDPMGGHVYSHGFGNNTTQYPFGIAASPAGDAFVVGRFQGTLDLGSGPITEAGQFDAFLATYDPGGAGVASHAYGDAQFQQASHVATSAAGEPIIAGTYNGTIDFGQGPIALAGSYGTFLAKVIP